MPQTPQSEVLPDMVHANADPSEQLPLHSYLCPSSESGKESDLEMDVTSTGLWHCCQSLYLLALPVSLSFPLARLLVALGPGSLTFTLCCPAPRRQVVKAMQK